MFFNFCNKTLDPSLTHLLTLGPKFIPPQPDSSDKEILDAFYNFRRSIRIRYAFDQNPRSDTIFVPHMYVKSAEYQPEKATENLELYLSSVRRKLRESLKCNPPIYTRELHPLARQALQFKADLNIVLTDSDKNLGPVILPTSTYEQLAETHLADAETYKQVTPEFVTSSCKQAMVEYNNIINQGFYETSGLWSKYRKVLQWLEIQKVQPHTIPKFRVIPKIHKAGELKSRPISGATNWITTAPATLSAYLLQPLLKMAEQTHVLKNSQTLISTLEGFKIPKNAILFSFDVVSLYTNMRFEEIEKTFAPILNERNLHATGAKLALWVLQYSFIQFKDRIFHQVSGMAMGTNMAVEVANLFLYFGIDLSKVIQDCLSDGKFLVWKRYIDDCVGIYNPNEDQANPRGLQHYLDHLNNLIPGIRFTMEQSDKSLNVLDLEMFKVPCPDDPDYCTIQFKTFQKSLNKYLYLPALSSHSAALQRGFVKGELIRHIRNCTNRVDFITVRNLFRTRLRLRGYPDNWIDSVFRTVSYSDRAQHLQPRESDNTNILPFIIRGNSRQRRLQIPKILKETHGFEYLQSEIKKARLLPTLCLKSGQPLSHFLYRDLTPKPFKFTHHAAEQSDTDTSDDSQHRAQKIQRRI